MSDLRPPTSDLGVPWSLEFGISLNLVFGIWSFHVLDIERFLRLIACPMSLVTLLEVRDSPVHGRGVYAKRAIPKGARIIEYTGKRMAWSDVPNEDDDPHTFIFALDNGKVINAEIDGNE